MRCYLVELQVCQKNYNRHSSLYNFDDIVLSIKQKMQNCQQLARKELMRFKETQGHKVKSNEYEFKENLVLLRVKTRQKLEPLWQGPFEIKQ
jgi:hypothetical protein